MPGQRRRSSIAIDGEATASRGLAARFSAQQLRFINGLGEPTVKEAFQPTPAVVRRLPRDTVPWSNHYVYPETPPVSIPEFVVTAAIRLRTELLTYEAIAGRLTKMGQPTNHIWTPGQVRHVISEAFMAQPL